MYVDGYVIPVRKTNRESYLEVARIAAPVFKEHGALKVVETWGDDVPRGKQTDFFMAVQCAEDENVVFSWIVWPDKATRDAGMAKVMQDPRMDMDPASMPFDGKRMIYGGFKTFLSF